jgi:hypothetical protein
LTKSVKWNLSVYVEDGPTLTSSEDFNAEAVDVVSIKVNKATSPTAATSSTVDVQPGELEEVKFIYIKSDLYGKVKYKFKSSGAGDPSAEVTLDKDHVLTSVQLVALFKVSPNKIIFTNSDVEKPANIQVVVARKAS